MYWDTLGPRWPLYPDMGDRERVSDELLDGRDDGGCCCRGVTASVGREISEVRRRPWC
jgi:hypothetical protein